MSGEARGRRGPWIAAAIATILALVYALPILPHPRARLWGDGGDAYGTLAGIAELAGFLAGGPRPRFGIDFQPLVDLPAGALALLLGPVLAYNLVLLASFPLAAWLGFRVARACGATPRGAHVAAQLFAFSPYHLAHAREHLDQAQVWPAALVLWAAIALVKRPSAATAAGLALATAVAAAINAYLPFLLLPLAAVAIGGAIASAPTWRVRGGVAAIVLGSLALALTIATRVPAIAAELSTRRARAADDADLVRYTARLGEYVRPAPSHPLRGRLSRLDDAGRHGSTAVEQTLDVGVVPLALALAGLIASLKARGVTRRVGLVVVVATLASLWLSLPPWWGASAWFHAAFPWVRAMARFALVVQLVVSIYAGVLLSRLSLAGVSLCALACALSYLPARSWHEVEPMEASAFLAANARAVADFPPDPYRYLRRFRRLDGVSIHGRAELALHGAVRLNDAATPERLAAMGVTHAIAHGVADPLATGLTEVGRFGATRILRVEAPQPPLAASFRQGFAAPEGEGRWLLGGAGILRLDTAPDLRAVGVELRFVAHTIAARELVLESDGLELVRVAVAPGRGHAVALRSHVAAPGRTLVVRARPPGQRTGSGDRAGDPRPLALHVSDFAIDPRSVMANDDVEIVLGVGIGAREPGDERWIAGRGELAITTPWPAVLRFAARGVDEPRLLTVTANGTAHESPLAASAWREVEIELGEGKAMVAIDGGAARSIRASSGAADDRRVSAAIRGLRVVKKGAPL